MNSKHYNHGYTLTELMITLGIIGVIAAIAIPSYNSYVATSKMGTARANALTLTTFEDAYFYENDSYLAGQYVPGGADTLSGPLEWAPPGSQDIYQYDVTAGPCGNIQQCYTVTVTNTQDLAIVQSISRP